MRPPKLKYPGITLFACRFGSCWFFSSISMASKSLVYTDSFETTILCSISAPCWSVGSSENCNSRVFFAPRVSNVYVCVPTRCDLYSSHFCWAYWTWWSKFKTRRGWCFRNLATMVLVFGEIPSTKNGNFSNFSWKLPQRYVSSLNLDSKSFLDSLTNFPYRVMFSLPHL